MNAPAQPAVTRPRAGLWRAMGRGWAVLLGAVVSQAVVQGLLVLGDPVATLSWSFAALVLASAVVLLLFVWLVTGAALGGVDGSVRAGITQAFRRPEIALGALLVGAAAFGAAMISPYLTPLTLLLAPFLLPAIAAGSSWTTAFHPIRRSPFRYSLAIVMYVVLAVLSWVSALFAGLFVTGFLGATLTWLEFGTVIVVELCLGSSLLRRSGPAA